MPVPEFLVEIGYGRRTDARLERGGGEWNLCQPRLGSGPREPDGSSVGIDCLRRFCRACSLLELQSIDA